MEIDTIQSIIKKRHTKKKLADFNATSYKKTFEPIMQMNKIWCPMNELRGLQCIGTVHLAGVH